MLIRRLAKRVQQKYFPTAHDRELHRWWADRGDYELRFSYPLNRESYVIDLGGHVGQFASDLYSRYRCHIVVFEPVSEFVAALRERFAVNDDIEVLPCGLGGRTRTETIGVSGVASSTFDKASRQQAIEIVDVEDWFSSRNVRRVDLMKINIEGGEFELLERLIDSGLIHLIRNVQVQFHEVAGDSESRMERIQMALLRTHSPTYQYKFVWENWALNESPA